MALRGLDFNILYNVPVKLLLQWREESYHPTNVEEPAAPVDFVLLDDIRDCTCRWKRFSSKLRLGSPPPPQKKGGKAKHRLGRGTMKECPAPESVSLQLGAFFRSK